MRKLASVQKIIAVNDIPGADNIQVASVLGWKCVVKKGEFKHNDLCIYCEVDSILPPRAEFAFLEARGYRIKTIKLKGQVSQGICFPISLLPDGIAYTEGDDVTETLGVTKYEPPIDESINGDVRCSFPYQVPKTDETRIQTAPELLQEMRGKSVYISIKMDGTSTTIANIYEDIHVCSRNLSMKDTEKSAYWNIVRKYNLVENLKKFGQFAVQGELVGPKIQNNPLCLKETDLYVFNVFDIQTQKYLSLVDMKNACQMLGLKTVPIIQENVTFDFTLEQLLEMAKGKYEGTKNHREGIVVRPMVETYSDVLSGRMSFKAINNDYLLKEK
jgi:RNA ligase (TIGR02306 family)